MRNQKEINERMRGILVDWLFAVQLKFKLKEDTLFLAINYLDRYLELREVTREKLQLIGATALFLASKYEEVAPPELKDFVYITDQAYNESEFIGTESLMLKTLGHCLTVVTPNILLSRLCTLDHKCTKRIYFLSNYLIELSLLEYRMLKHKPSVQAAAALYVSHKICKVAPVWEKSMEKYTGYSESTLKSCAKDMLGLIHGIEKTKLTTVKEKYEKPERLEVSKNIL